VQLPWVKTRKDQAEMLDARSHNTEVENKVLDVAKNRFSLADTGKVSFDNQHLHRKWKRFDEIFRNRQWHEVVTDDRSTPVLNFTFAVIQSLVPRLADSNPEVIVKPKTSPDDNALAEKIQAGLHHLWYKNKMREDKIREVILHMLKYGTSLIKTVWNPDELDGLGDVEYHVVHPLNFYPDPRAYNIEGMEYYFVKMPKSMEYFLRRWPNKGHLVRPDSEWMESETLSGRGRDTGEETATLMEYGFRDENGDVCIMYYAGNIVLDIFGGEYDILPAGHTEDGEPILHEYEDTTPVLPHNRFPFARVVDYFSDKEFWGIGEIELAEIAQNLINSFESSIIDNTRLMSNNQWLVNKSLSGLDETDAQMLDNTPGSAIFTHGGGVERIQGASIPAHIPAHLESLIFWLEQILGVHDVVQGRQPEGVRAASAIIALQEASNIRVKEKANHLEAGIREISEQAVALMLEYYEEDRMVRVAGDNVPTTLNVREALQERVLDMAQQAGLMAPPQAAVPGMEMGMPGMEMGMGMEMGGLPQDGMAHEMEMEQLMSEIKFPEFDIEISVGPSIPQSQALLYEQAKEFYQLGIIDRQAVLEVSNFPNKEEIMSRMDEMEGMAAELERVGERTR